MSVPTPYLGPCRHDKPDCQYAAKASVWMWAVNEGGIVGNLTKTLCYMGPLNGENCFQPHFKKGGGL